MQPENNENNNDMFTRALYIFMMGILLTACSQQQEPTTQTAGISDAARLNNKGKKIKDQLIYNLQGQRLSSLQKGLNIVDGQKVYVK